MNRGKTQVLLVYVGVGVPPPLPSPIFEFVLLLPRLCLLGVLLRVVDQDVGRIFFLAQVLSMRSCCC